MHACRPFGRGRALLTALIGADHQSTAVRGELLQVELTAQQLLRVDRGPVARHVVQDTQRSVSLTLRARGLAPNRGDQGAVQPGGVEHDRGEGRGGAGERSDDQYLVAEEFTVRDEGPAAVPHVDRKST